MEMEDANKKLFEEQTKKFKDELTKTEKRKREVEDELDNLKKKRNCDIDEEGMVLDELEKDIAQREEKIRELQEKKEDLQLKIFENEHYIIRLKDHYGKAKERMEQIVEKFKVLQEYVRKETTAESHPSPIRNARDYSIEPLDRTPDINIPFGSHPSPIQKRGVGNFISDLIGKANKEKHFEDESIIFEIGRLTVENERLKTEASKSKNWISHMKDKKSEKELMNKIFERVRKKVPDERKVEYLPMLSKFKKDIERKRDPIQWMLNWIFVPDTKPHIKRLRFYFSWKFFKRKENQKKWSLVKKSLEN